MNDVSSSVSTNKSTAATGLSASELKSCYNVKHYANLWRGHIRTDGQCSHRRTKCTLRITLYANSYCSFDVMDNDN